MAIQHRHGDFKDFDPNKMVTAELAVVTSGDPVSPTGRTLYVCFAPGVVKRIVSYEDFENELQNATEEIQQAFTQEIRTAITNSIAATNAANEAKEAADLAAEAARKAAEAAGAYVLGDISGKTVKFSEAETRENINTGESTATTFGKIKKWFADLKNIAFTGDYGDLSNVPEIVNNRATTKEGTVLDGRQGKDIQGELDKLNKNKADIEDVTNKFNWGAAIDYKAIRVGKVIFFRATCTAKSPEPMNFVTTKDDALNPFMFMPLTTYTVAGADFTKRAVAYVQGRTVTVTVYENYTSAKTVAPAGNIAVCGCWIIK
ncbi:hypothetical protein [Parablautia sp. Marseille-Q6255]|uniref:hypothetical protein n=1 Tax=Parablautia sp. Marseille-Q6255 TaxID=3039593 RepID=UPI0024BCF86B|nr:hypothetical protein [Parablautia sp. Marseille-Q6255]